MSTAVGQRRVVAHVVLGPCARRGVAASDTDWWEEQHVWCDGESKLAAGVVVQCACPCHTDPGSSEAHARAAAEQLAHDRLAMDATRAWSGEANWRDLRGGRTDGRFPG